MMILESKEFQNLDAYQTDLNLKEQGIRPVIKQGEFWTSEKKLWWDKNALFDFYDKRTIKNKVSGSVHGNCPNYGKKSKWTLAGIGYYGYARHDNYKRGELTEMTVYSLLCKACNLFVSIHTV